MAMVLKRLLRIRSLLEEAGRVDLERQVNQARRAEEATRRVALAASEAHLASLAPWLDTPPGLDPPPRPEPGVPGRSCPVETSAEKEARRLAEAECEAGLARARDLQRFSEQQTRRVLVLRDAYLSLRKERQQVEILLEEAARRRCFTEARRAQRELDDWFASSTVRGGRDRSGGAKA